jgi:hypothetical protein
MLSNELHESESRIRTRPSPRTAAVTGLCSPPLSPCNRPLSQHFCCWSHPCLLHLHPPEFSLTWQTFERAA